MAKFDISVDTATATLTVSLDGKKLDNVDSVRVYNGYKYNYDNDTKEPCVSVDVGMCTNDKEAGVRTYTSVMAKDKSVVIEDKSLVQMDIAKFLGK